MRRVSKALAKERRRYKKLRDEFLIGKSCVACEARGLPANAATEIHHCRGRLGRLLCDERFWMSVCTQQHRWIHDNPKEARELGLLCELGQWNSYPEE